MDPTNASSDESSSLGEPDSTGPTTPERSPSLHPQNPLDSTPLGLSIMEAIGESAVQDRSIGHVCVIGAGYVGMKIDHCRNCRVNNC
jgi:hypothetical protein